MELLTFSFIGPICNNKENRNWAPPPGCPMAIFFIFMAVKFTSQNSKIAKYGSDFTNFENIAKMKKIFYQYSIGGHFLFYNF